MCRGCGWKGLSSEQYAGSVIITPDNPFLFVTNGGDNSVSSFAVGEDGELTLKDVKRTGNVIAGGAKSLGVFDWYALCGTQLRSGSRPGDVG